MYTSFLHPELKRRRNPGNRLHLRSKTNTAFLKYSPNLYTADTPRLTRRRMSGEQTDEDSRLKEADHG